MIQVQKIFILILMNFKMSKAGSKNELYTGTTLVNREIYTSFVSGIKILQTILFTGTITSANGSGNCFINLKFTIIISNLQLEYHPKFINWWFQCLKKSAKISLTLAWMLEISNDSAKQTAMISYAVNLGKCPVTIKS